MNIGVRQMDRCNGPEGYLKYNSCSKPTSHEWCSQQYRHNNIYPQLSLVLYTITVQYTVTYLSSFSPLHPAMLLATWAILVLSKWVVNLHTKHKTKSKPQHMIVAFTCAQIWLSGNKAVGTDIQPLGQRSTYNIGTDITMAWNKKYMYIHNVVT